MEKTNKVKLIIGNKIYEHFARSCEDGDQQYEGVLKLDSNIAVKLASHNRRMWDIDTEVGMAATQLILESPKEAHRYLFSFKDICEINYEVVDMIEHALAVDGSCACSYAIDCLRGPWDETTEVGKIAVNSIMNDGVSASHYAIEVLNEPWPRSLSNYNSIIEGIIADSASLIKYSQKFYQSAWPRKCPFYDVAMEKIKNMLSAYGYASQIRSIMKDKWPCDSFDWE